MTAEIVSVGTELLLGQIVDTHAATMAKILADCGLVCQRRATVGDNFDRLCSVLREALNRSDVVITIGGLGPTMDDLTRDAIAHVLGDTMERVPAMEQELRDLFAVRNLRWTDSIARQADKPTCARFIENPNGTAPGLICEKNGKRVLALPGPKGEFDPMAKGPVRDYLCSLSDQVIHSVVVRVVGLGESHVEDLIRPLMESDNPTVAPYAHPGEVSLRVTARAPSRQQAQALVDPVLEQIRSVLGRHVFAVNDTTLEEALQEAMAARCVTVAVAESMTGGELAARLSAAPGSSQTFMGGIVVYTVAAKRSLLGLGDEDLADGPVSARTAEAMARSIRERLGATFGVAITGNAGPTADVDGKPVGLVFLGLAGPDGVQSREQTYRAQREDVRRRATQASLTWLRDAVLGHQED